MKRFLALGDMHCGHWSGLTPPQFEPAEGTSELRQQQHKFRRELWDWYCKTLDEIGPVDAALLNGDLVDGPGHGSGGSEIIIPEQDQGDCATLAAQKIQTDTYYLTYGTAYHTGKSVDSEYFIAQRLGGDIQDRQYLEINGTTIKAVHHAGGSSIAHGVHTFTARAAVNNKLAAMQEHEPEAHISLFSHRHFFSYAGAANYFSMRLPCLQGASSKYGRRCDGQYDMGMVLFEFDDNGAYTWKAYLLKSKAAVPQVSVI